jgi:hypothetical protein
MSVLLALVLLDGKFPEPNTRNPNNAVKQPLTVSESGIKKLPLCLTN